MAAEDLTRILHVPGRLCLGPTNLALAYPHGGTALGYAREISLAPTQKYYEVVAEEFGGEVVEVGLASSAWILGAIFRQLDNDVLARLFPNTAAGASGDRVISHPGPVQEGPFLSGVVLLFSPDDATNGVAALFYRAIPLLDESAKLAIRLADPLEFPALFRATRESAGAGRAVSVGRLADLAL